MQTNEEQTEMVSKPGQKRMTGRITDKQDGDAPDIEDVLRERSAPRPSRINMERAKDVASRQKPFYQPESPHSKTEIDSFEADYEDGFKEENNPIDSLGAKQAERKLKVQPSIKVKVLMPIFVRGRGYQPGQEATLTENEAKEFCDRIFEGAHDHDGESSSRRATRYQCVRAKRV